MGARTLTVRHLASTLRRYREGLALQEALAAGRRSNELGDQLLLLQVPAPSIIRSLAARKVC